MIEKHNLLLKLGQTLDGLRQDKIQLETVVNDLGNTPYQPPYQQDTLSGHPSAPSNTPR